MRTHPAGLSSDRACPPGETFSKVSPFLSKLGITRIGRQTNLDRIGIPVWCAYTPNAKSIVIAQGKGLDDEAARVSAVMEAIERAVATRPACRAVDGTVAAFRADGMAVDPLQPLIGAGADPLRDDETIEWTRATDLVTSQAVWVPFHAVHLDRSASVSRYWQSSDGLASGNTVNEATLHGLLEQVERDAITLWNVTSPRRRYEHRIDVATIAHAGVQEMLLRISKAGHEIALYDISTDITIPCVAALLGPRDLKPGSSVRHVDITFGAGASLKPDIAAARAIAEAVQSRMTYIAGARDDVLPEFYARPADPSSYAGFAARHARSIRDLPEVMADTADQALPLLVERLRLADVPNIYVVDLTPDWLPVSVVKVLVPKLENARDQRRVRYGVRALSKSLQ